MKFSYFECALDKNKTKHDKVIGINEYMNIIKNDEDMYISVMNLRNIRKKNPEAYKKGKTKIPSVMASGVFGAKDAKSLLEHSGIIAIDIDAKDLPEGTDILELKKTICEDPYTFICHLSLSGEGLVVFVQINPTRHLDAFLGLEKYYAVEYGIIIDSSCKNVNRHRFLSHDKDLFWNGRYRKFAKYLPPKEKKKLTFQAPIFGEADIDFVAKQISDRGIDLVDNYDDWVKIGMSLSREGAAGRRCFHIVSQQNSKYDDHEVDKKFDNFERHTHDIGIGTFFWYAKEVGCELQSHETKQIIRDVRIAKKLKKNKQELLNEYNDKKLDAIIEQAFDSINEDDYIAQDKTEIKLVLRKYLSSLDLKYNEILMRYEFNGHPVDDRKMNSMFADACEIISPDLSLPVFRTFLESEDRETYNPITNWLESASEKFPKHHFEESDPLQRMCDCFEIENFPKEYSDKFIKNWITGLVSLAYGQHSEYILVLMGKQRIHKTKFFNDLLPKKLHDYKSPFEFESKNDVIMLMSKKWLLFDDEFGGKSRKDEKLVKKLASTDEKWFRQAYGRNDSKFKRLAGLGGTTNEDHVINDPSGNRRILPMLVNSIDFEAMSKIDREELFAQAYHLFKADRECFFLSIEDIEVLNECSEEQTVPKVELDIFYKYFKSIEQASPNELENKVYLSPTSLIDELYRLSETRHTLSLKKIGQYLTAEGFKKVSKRVNGSNSPSKVYELIRRNNFFPSEN